MVSTNSPIDEKETLDVTASVKNIGARQHEGTISLDIDGVERDSKLLDLASNESTNITLSWNTSGGDVGDYEAVISSEDTSASMPVTVEQLTQWIDNFEDGDTSGWQSVNDIESIESTTVLEGQHSIKVDGSISLDRVFADSKNLQRTVSRGDDLRVAVYLDSSSTSSSQFSFDALVDVNNIANTGYEFIVSPASDAVAILDSESDSVISNIGTLTSRWSFDEWFIMNIKLGSPTLSFSLETTGGSSIVDTPATADDSKHSGDGITLHPQSSDGSDEPILFFDDIKKV